MHKRLLKALSVEANKNKLFSKQEIERANKLLERIDKKHERE